MWDTPLGGDPQVTLGNSHPSSCTVPAGKCARGPDRGNALPGFCFLTELPSAFWRRERGQQWE